MAKTRGIILTTLQSVARLARTVSAKRLYDQGLYAGQDKIILALAHENGQTPGTLAQKLRVKPPTITKTINRLAAQGFLEKRSSDQDARRTHIYLTPLGEEAIRQIESSLKKVEEQALNGFDKEDLKTLKRLLDQMAENLSDEPEKSRDKQGSAHDGPAQNSRSG